MKENVIIDIPERLEDDIEDWKLDCVDEEKNYTAAKIKLTRDPEDDTPRIFYSQELSRNFKKKSKSSKRTPRWLGPWDTGTGGEQSSSHGHRWLNNSRICGTA